MDNLFKSAVECYQNKQFEKAENICLKILELDPNNFDATNLLAAISYQNKNYSKSIELFRKATEINPNRFDIYNNLSIVLLQENKLKEAIHSWDQAIKLNPNFSEGYFGKGNAFTDLKDYSQAIDNFKKALEIKPDYKQAYNNLASVYANLKDYKNAIKIFKKAINIKPVHFNEYNNLGNIYYESYEFNKAIENYNLALKINPDFPLIYYNKAKALYKINLKQEAIFNYEKAISINKNFAEAYKNLGNLYLDLKTLEKSIYNHEQALKINPKIKYLSGTILQSKCGMCDWRNFKKEKEILANDILNGKKAASPFSTILIYDSPSIQKMASNLFVESEFKKPKYLKNKKQNKKIRVAYYSADFHNHATMYLMANLFELHDKTKFETFAFSFGPNDESQIRKRVSKSFDKFFDVKLKNTNEIVKLSRDLNIDIAVDLKGFTNDNRFDLFVERCAPIQISYLGYPGTLASDSIDYLVADKTLIPEENKKFYSEKIIYMPNTYQVNDSTLKVSEKKFERKDLGLPEKGIVFCSFNQSYKILPDMFRIWIRILKKVENSVLWLMTDNEITEKNLKNEFIKNEIKENRLIFASRMHHQEHLSRLKLADIFLDTFPYNAHTTASDALRVGIPVVTLKGQSFASRVASSLLNCLDLNELITDNENEYQKVAIKLAENNSLLQEIKRKINHNVSTKPLFDTKLFTQHLENAYITVIQKLKKNESLDHIEIN